MIDASKLRKTYGAAIVLDDESLRVGNADGVLPLGPNGPGKTPSPRSPATLLRPSAGTVTVNGVDAVRCPDQIRALIGMVAHGTYVYEDLTALENLRFWVTMQGGSATPTRLREALEQVGLDGFAAERVRMFSAGVKRGLSLAPGVLGKPRGLLPRPPSPRPAPPGPQRPRRCP